MEYPVRYLSKKEKLDEDVIEQVMNIVKNVLNTKAITTHYHIEYLFWEYIMRDYRIELCDRRDHLRLAILANGKGVPETNSLKSLPDEVSGKRYVSNDKINMLTQKYLIGLCRTWVNSFGSDLFIPAKLDALFQDGDDKESNEEYYMAWLGYEICRELVDKEKRAVAIVIQSAEKL